jgi:hypothetical protein
LGQGSFAKNSACAKLAETARIANIASQSYSFVQIGKGEF